MDQISTPRHTSVPACVSNDLWSQFHLVVLSDRAPRMSDRTSLERWGRASLCGFKEILLAFWRCPARSHHPRRMTQITQVSAPSLQGRSPLSLPCHPQGLLVLAADFRTDAAGVLALVGVPLSSSSLGAWAPGSPALAASLLGALAWKRLVNRVLRRQHQPQVPR